MFSSFFFIESYIICQYRNIEKRNRILRREEYAIGSHSSLGFRALWKDVDWTVAETPEHLSGRQIFGNFYVESSSNFLQDKTVMKETKT